MGRGTGSLEYSVGFVYVLLPLNVLIRGRFA